MENSFNYVSSKEDLIYVLESPIDRYFNTWSESQLSSSENYLTFEEDFQFNLITNNDVKKNNILLSISGGELDNIFRNSGYLEVSSNLRFAHKFLNWWLRTKFETLPSNVTKLDHLKRFFELNLILCCKSFRKNTIVRTKKRKVPRNIF